MSASSSTPHEHELISVEVLYFAVARQKTGLQRESLSFASPLSLGGLRSKIYERHRELIELDPYLRWAVNQRFVEGECELQTGDVIALIPPISGG